MMSTWRDPETWAKWIRGEECPICASISSDHAVAELEFLRVMMSADAPMRGYVWLPFRRHVVELHELSEIEGVGFINDLRRVSRVIQLTTGAVKLNYEIHGNTVPHLHVHIFPRYPGDRFEGAPINPKIVCEPVYQPGEFDVLRTQVRDRLLADAV
jgi:diadenosine tetraphosphate (Ap4A) HIT family hydrolase